MDNKPDMISGGKGLQAWIGDGGSNWISASSGLPTSEYYEEYEVNKEEKIKDLVLSLRVIKS